MKREMVCVVCPNSCEIEVTCGGDGRIVSVAGAMCRRGEAYARQETVSPMRTIASSVKVNGGELPLCSVRLTKPVPLGEIMRVMGAIRAAALEAPVFAGDVVIKNVLGLGSDVIATKSVQKKGE